MAEVRLTMEEYEALVAGFASMDTRTKSGIPKATGPKRKRVGKKDPKMARALKKANSIGRTKSGKLRKGYTQAKIMKKAHQLRRKM